MRSLFAVVAVVGFACCCLFASESRAASIDSSGYDADDLNEDDLREYFQELQEYLRHQAQRTKRARFCLKRDMTCPDQAKKDFCCKGSQCSCNIFGQNCKCSAIGLFQRLG